MTINAAWHKSNVLPRNASVEQRIEWHRAHRTHCGCRPIPAKLLAQMDAMAAGRRARPLAMGVALRELLSGGDRRSLARSGRVRAIVRSAPARITELASLAEDADALVAMRALDLLEKLAHEHPEWVQPHKQLFIGRLAQSERWEFRLQIVRALPLLRWTPRERKRVIEILRRELDHPQKFVRAWALDSLASFAREDPALMPLVLRSLDQLERSGSNAWKARARQIRARLGDPQARRGADSARAGRPLRPRRARA